MASTKQKVMKLLDQLPEECTLEQVLYHLYVLDNVEKGLAEADEGHTIPHEVVAKELRSKWIEGRSE